MCAVYVSAVHVISIYIFYKDLKGAAFSRMPSFKASGHETLRIRLLHAASPPVYQSVCMRAIVIFIFIFKLDLNLLCAKTYISNNYAIAFGAAWAKVFNLFEKAHFHSGTRSFFALNNNIIIIRYCTFRIGKMALTFDTVSLRMWYNYYIINRRHGKSIVIQWCGNLFHSNLRALKSVCFNQEAFVWGLHFFLS